MRADGAGHGEAFVPVAKDKDLLVGQKRRRAEGEIGRVADLESLRRFVKHAGRQKPHHRGQAHAHGRHRAPKPAAPQLRKARRFMLCAPSFKYLPLLLLQRFHGDGLGGTPLGAQTATNALVFVLDDGAGLAGGSPAAATP